jgi:hypothetical protein
MYAQLTITTLATLAFAIPANSASRFALNASGAISVTAAGPDARYGLIPADVNGHPSITISLGANNPAGSLQLTFAGDRLPAPGRYSLQNSSIQAAFSAGSAEHPVGWFHGELGWVTVTKSAAGHLSGEFEIQARGFVTANLDDENRLVTVRGSFDAEGDSAVTTIASVR